MCGVAGAGTKDKVLGGHAEKKVQHCFPPLMRCNGVKCVKKKKEKKNDVRVYC